MSVYFNENQLRAVKHTAGPMMVLAGPGSGKTTVITGRLENLIKREGIPAENILVVTFSKKAALEMKDRFLKKCPGLEKNPAFGTFHSIFYMIIRQEGSSLKVISEAGKYRAVRSALESLNFDFESSPAFISQIINEISRVKGNVLDINKYLPESVPEEIFRFVCKKYDEYLKANGLVDFDDMQLKCFLLLKSDPEILKKWQERFKFILIDEFQDINLLQYEIIRLLSGNEKNIFIVGDDDQSIYGFRGAKPELMKRFLRDFKDAGQILLDINYRSTPEIVSAAGRIIKENEYRFSKNIRTYKKEKSGCEVSVLKFSNIKEEADDIIKKIRELQKNKIPLSEIAILFRNNADMEYISKRLSDAGTDFAGKSKKDSLYNHFIYRDITAYLKSALDYPACGLSDILLIMNRPSRYISRGALSYDEPPFKSMKHFYAENRRMLPVINEFENSLKLLKSLPPFAAVKYIRNAIGYDRFILELAQENNANFSKYAEVLEKLEVEAAKFKSVPLWLSYINSELQKDETNLSFKKDSALNQLKDRDKSKSSDGINIMTIHASKGLEWEAVFIPTCIDAIIPGKNTGTQSALEEERRVLYVAATRAKSFLQISSVENYKGKKARQSRFLNVLI